jgi:hypothetical protein
MTSENSDRGRTTGANPFSSLSGIIRKTGKGPLLAAVLLGSTMSLAGSANAQSADTSAFKDGILACQRIEQREARFRCYDALERGDAPAAVVTPAIPAGTPPAAAPAVSEQAQQQRDFGRSESKKEKKSIQSVSVEIVSAKRNAYGYWVFRTSEGQAWRQVGGSKSISFRDLPFQAEISKALLSGFYFRPGGRKIRFRVKRIK